MMFVTAVAVTGIFAPPARAEVVTAVEYYHQAFEHYFVTSNPAEIAALDTGMVQGWWRTGQRYRVDDAPAAGLEPVCRFYTAAFAGKASHFFTASAAECKYLKASPDWSYEGVAFYARVPDAQGNCGAGTAAINRLYNNGIGGAPNHAYTADGVKRDTLVNAGWVSEGVAYCTPLAAGDPMAQTLILDGSTWDLPSPAIYSTDTMFDYAMFYSHGIRIGFVPITTATTEEASNWFASLGSRPPAAILDMDRGPEILEGGAAAWDPLVGEYVLFIDSVYPPQGYWGMMWTFDNAQGPTTPVCTMGIWHNLVSVQPYIPHPFQEYLLSGCEPGVATRL
jgi:hypothetical protein